MPLSPGDRLGPYEIVSQIGKGGMGEVWKARDPRLGRDVAIKVSAHQFTDRFEREARAIAALNHTNICILHDVGPNYLVMELIEGPTLADRIRQGPIPLEEALSIAKQIADALEAAHEKNIVHRDLKPANIKIRPDGSVKVLDFGLAKADDSQEVTADSPTMMPGTMTGMILGTAGYMSPEQARGQEVDKRADIWAFGVVLYEMVTGKRLFDGPTVSDSLAAILKEEPDLSLAPPKTRRLLQACLEKDPRKRLHDIGDAWRLLVDAPAVAGNAPGRRYWTFGLAALVVAAAGLGAAWRMHPAPVPAPRLKITLETPADERWTNPELAPDGTRIAFNTREGIRVRAVDSLETQLIKGARGRVAWSPDGSSLVYCNNSYELRKVTLSSGTSQTIAPGCGPLSRGAAWNKDGTILFSAGGQMMRVSENGGTPVAITAEPALYPTVLPDGRHYLFLHTSGGGGPSSLYAGSLDSKDKSRITDANSKAILTPSGHLLFLRDTTLMAQKFDSAGLRVTGEAFPVASDVSITSVTLDSGFSASANGLIVFQTGSVGRTALTWVDRSGKPSGVLDDANRYYDMELSPDGKALAATRVDPKTLGSPVWVTDLARRVTSRLTPEVEQADFPSWSPDGRQISYGAAGQLYIRDSTGTGQRELMASRGTMSHWSPDAKSLVFVDESTTTPLIGSLRLVPTTGDHKPRLYLEGRFAQPMFSPDGRWMAYISEESGRSEVYVQPVPAGHGKWQISARGGTQPIWRRDGKELFYRSADNKIMAVPVTLPIASGGNFEAGIPKELFPISTTGSPQIRRQYSVNPDGQRFLVNQTVDEHPQIILLQNWLGAAR